MHVYVLVRLYLIYIEGIRKYIPLIENAIVIIYVASLATYNKWNEDGSNEMHNSLDFYSNQINSELIVNKSVILFLNKRDLFEQQILTTPISVAFSDYNGVGDDYQESVDFIYSKFQERNSNTSRYIFFHFTCALDQDLIRRVFDDVQHLVTMQSLASIDIGLL